MTLENFGVRQLATENLNLLLFFSCISEFALYITINLLRYKKGGSYVTTVNYCSSVTSFKMGKVLSSLLIFCVRFLYY